MESFGKDLDCVTQISLDSLKEIKEKLLKIEIFRTDITQKCCRFIFESGYYDASGFNIGYWGEGPRGLWKAISMFYPNLYPSFEDSKINLLKHHINYEWTPEDGFK